MISPTLLQPNLLRHLLYPHLRLRLSTLILQFHLFSDNMLFSNKFAAIIHYLCCFRIRIIALHVRIYITSY